MCTAGMGRAPKGVSMPKTKKKKLVQPADLTLVVADADPNGGGAPASAHSPNSTSLQPVSQDPEKKARRDANLALKEALKVQRRQVKSTREIQLSCVESSKLQSELFDIRWARHMKKCKDPVWMFNAAHKNENVYWNVEKSITSALHHHDVACWGVSKAQLVCKDLQIARPTRLLKEANGP